MLTAAADAPSLRRSALAILGWVDAAACHGLDGDQLLDGTGLTRSDVVQLDMLVEPWQELMVIQRLAVALPDQAGLGVIAGTSCTVGSLGSLALVCLSLETVGEAVDQGERLLGLTFAFVAPVLEWDGSDLVVTMDDRHLHATVRELVMERDLTAFLQIIDAVAEDLSGIFIGTSLGPESIAALRGVAHGIPVEPSAQNTVRLAARVLASRTRQANPIAAADWLLRAEADLERRRGSETIALKVKTAVVRRVDDPPPAADLARSFHMDERTLRRRLAREGTSYRAIVDEARRVLAIDLIRFSDLSIERIAEQTGYNDAAAFSAAFKRWQGESPGRYRQRTLGDRRSQ
jgi:AraC-like DNA-binding protein